MLREEDIPLRPHASPVRVYRVADLPPEEQAKYQPVRPTRRDLQEAAANGLSVEEVAAKFGKTAEWVKTACRQWGITLRRSKPQTGGGDDAMRKPLNADKVSILRECHQQGLHYTQAAKRADVSLGAAYNYYRKFRDEVEALDRVLEAVCTEQIRSTGNAVAAQPDGEVQGQAIQMTGETERAAEKVAVAEQPAEAVQITNSDRTSIGLCQTCIKQDVCLIPDALAVLTPPKPALDVTGKLDRIELDLAMVLRRCSAYWPA